MRRIVTPPLVSVCMITYNHGDFIRMAIEGVLMQDVNFEIELIIADDASIDSTEDIVMDLIQYHKNGNRIKYHKHSNNKGMMSNFFWALNECKGKYIALCEGDDYWIDAKKISTQVSFLDLNPKYSLSFHDCKVVNANNQLLSNSRLPRSSKKSLSKIEMKLGRLIPTASVVFRSNILPPKFPINLLNATNGDYILFYYLSRYGGAYFHDCALYSTYRIHDGGVWSLLDKFEKHSLQLNTYLLMKDNFNGVDRFYLYRNISNLYYEIAKYYKVNNFENSKKYFLNAIKYSCLSVNYKIFLFSIIKVLK